MKDLNIKAKKKDVNSIWLVLVVFFLAILPSFVKADGGKLEFDLVPNIPEVKVQRRVMLQEYEVGIINVVQDSCLERIQGVWERMGSPIADKVPYVYSEASKRGLEPELVLAVMAKESGWGRSCYKGNCFGYGATDSGNIDKWFPGDFETATEMILDSYAQFYNVDTAEEMAARGYNFHEEWVVGVNIIRSYFNERD